MATSDIFLQVAEALLDVVRPLEQALQTVEGVEALLLRYGWQTPETQAYVSDIQNVFTLTTDIEGVVQQIEQIVANDDFTLDDALNILKLAIDVVQKIRALVSSPPTVALPPPLNDPNFWPSFAGDIAQDLFAEYLQVYLPALYAPLHMLGIVDEVPTPANGANGRVDYVRSQIRWDRLGKLVSNPASLMSDVYSWGGTFQHDKFVRRLQRVLMGFGLPASIYRPFHGLVSQYYSDTNPALSSVNELRAPVFIDSSSDIGYADLGLALLPIPPANQKDSVPSGFLVGPYVRGSVQEEFPLGGPFTLSLHGGLDSEDPVGLEIRPDGVGVQISVSGTTIDAGMALQAARSTPWIIFGTPNTHRLEVVDFRLGIDVAGPIADPEIKFNIGTSKLSLIIQFDEGDGFLNKIFGTDPQTLSAAGNLSWSSKTGLAFSGNVGITLTIPVHLNISVANIDTITIALKLATGGELDVVAAVTGGTALGPVAASVQSLGVKLQAIPVAQGQNAGAFGDLDLKFGLKFPDGLGFSIDAGAVAGGGFILCDQAKGEYAGLLDISIVDIIQVKFIAILDTKLPDGKPGYSLLFVIFMELPPIQLGFGFTLNGVGGIAGLNRTMSIDGLHAGLRNHTLDYVINPPHSVEDAPKVISAVGSFFPPAEGRYLFGPILEVGWETFIQVTLGVILEVPDPIRLALLGIIDAGIPTIDEALVKIHIDVLGTVDFGTDKLAIDGSMYDSYVLEFPIAGDLALRFSWGSNPNFVFSLGGFNPHFNTTGLDVPQLARLSISIGEGDNPRISANSYMALTSNTVQFGASVEAWASAGGFSVHGYMGFDVLFTFSPYFAFEVDFSASFDVSYQGTSLAGLNVTGVLTGFKPYHFHGDASFHILFFSVSKSVDFTWGDSNPPALPQRAVLTDLIPALQDPRNWTATLPDGASPCVTFSNPAATPGNIIVHPMGTLTVRQKVVPLDQPISRYNNANTSDGNYFSISNVAINGQPATKDPFPDYFAMGQFLDLSDADKLGKPSFEPADAGVKIASSSFCSGADCAQSADYLEFYVYDPNNVATFSQVYTMPADVYDALSRRGGGFLAPANNTGFNKYKTGPSTPAITTKDPSYVVTNVNDLSVRSDIVPANGANYFQAQAAVNAHLVAHPQDRGNVQIMPTHEVTP